MARGQLGAGGCRGSSAGRNIGFSLELTVGAGWAAGLGAAVSVSFSGSSLSSMWTCCETLLKTERGRLSSLPRPGSCELSLEQTWLWWGGRAEKPLQLFRREQQAFQERFYEASLSSAMEI